VYTYPTGGWRVPSPWNSPASTAGTVSGTALDIVYVRLLQLGDPGGPRPAPPWQPSMRSSV